MHAVKLIFLLLLAISTNCVGQENKPADITDITKITLLNPGISYEKRIGKFQSLLGHVFMNTSFYYRYSSTFGGDANINFDPALSLQYRYYYNHTQRERKGKRTAMNSLNYISPTFEMSYSRAAISSSYLTEFNRRPINIIGVTWGFQRNYPRHFSLDLNLGVGYRFTTATSPVSSGPPVKRNIGEVATMGQLNLGFWLNGKK